MSSSAPWTPVRPSALGPAPRHPRAPAPPDASRQGGEDARLPYTIETLQLVAQMLTASYPDGMVRNGLASCLLAASLVLTPEHALAGAFEDALAAYNRSDYAEALRLWRALAKQGDASAQDRLADMYYVGDGVPRDDAQAVYWYRKAAEQGFARA